VKRGLSTAAGIAVLGLVAAGLATGARSITKTLTAHSGSVRVWLSYTPVRFFEASNVRLKITRNGRTAYDRKVSTQSRPTRLRARDLDGMGDPEILADFYTGGAHCCNFTLVYHYSGSTYLSTKHIWGDLDYRLKDLNGDGDPDFLTGDDRFAYRFTSYAGSAFPIRIWTYRGGRLIDVTRGYSGLVTADAASQWRDYLAVEKTQDPDPRGILAAWAADEFMIGNKTDALAKLNALAQQGKLTGDPIWPQGQKYVAALEKFLTKLGYGAA
jgi:hypothetical protein